MKILSKKLYLTDVYSYDISACHYTILKKLGYDMSQIPEHDKAARNIEIGLRMRDNPSLTTILRSVTESLISEYIVRNSISEEDLVLRQYDGILTTKKLVETDSFLPLELRGIFDVFLASSDRTKFVGKYKNGEFVAKGVPYLYENIEKFLEKILTADACSKSALFSRLQRIRDEFFAVNDPLVFCIPTDDEKFLVTLKGYGQVRVSKSATKMISCLDIDKQSYWNFYLRPFCESLVIEFG